MKKQKICLVTGASSGIGKAIATYLAKDDSNQVVITARREDRLKELLSDNVYVLPGDLNSYEFQNSLENHIY